jgi:hypothetical protein
VGLPGIMLVEADLMYDIGDVEACERQVLEGSSEAHEVSWISNRRPGLGRNLGLCVHRRQNRFIVHHASTLKNTESKLAPSEEESVCLMLYGDPQKVMEGLRSFMANSHLRADMVCCRSASLDAVRRISST